MTWQFSDILKATASTSADGNVTITGIAIDNRNVVAGDLFVAINGVHHDGHDYVNAAHDAGAVAAMVERPVDCAIPQILIDDSLKALTDLARAARARTDAKIIAVTGSVGKTGTRHLLDLCFSAQGKTHASKGNFNNHIGAPFSLAGMPEQSAFGVFELGMNNKGEIANLSPLVKPDLAIITRIASSHVGNFANIEEIAAAKAEIFDGLNQGGIAVLNADDDFTPFLAEAALNKGASKVIKVGTHGDADVRIDSINRRDHGLDLSISLDGKPVSFSLGMMAPHWALSAAMSLAAVHYLGGDIMRSISALADAKDLKGRGERHAIALADGRRITLIDDSYNASPASMVAAIKSLAQDPAPSSTGRKVAILGDMLELGAQSADLHAGLASTIEHCGISVLITFGDHMENLAEAVLQHKGVMNIHTANANEAIAAANSALEDGDIVLVKGSNGMKTSLVTDAFTQQSSSRGGPHAA